MVLAFHSGTDGQSSHLTRGEVCRRIFEQYGCGTEWDMEESREPAVFEIAAQTWWVFRRHRRPLAGSLADEYVRFYHGTTLDVAIKILSEGFLVGDGRHGGTMGMFGISAENGNHDFTAQCVCRRLAIDRAKPERSRHTGNGYPIDAWATRVSLCILLRPGSTRKLASFKSFKFADIQKKCLVHEFEGQRLTWTKTCYIEVHIPSREYIRTQTTSMMPRPILDYTKCYHCNKVISNSENYNWKTSSQFICPECFCWHHRIQL